MLSNISSYMYMYTRYDPVFLVETVDGRRVWTKRHYRCTPRKALGSEGKQKGSTPGLWTFSTLDNGVVRCC